MIPPLPTPSFIARATRFFGVRAAIRPLARWRPIESPIDGYTILLACNAPLASMLHLQMALLDRQDRAGLHEVIVVFDRPADRLGCDIEAQVRDRWPDIPTRFVYYSPAQERRLDRVAWSKCYSWLSWCLGLAEVRTRHALLHDFDAFPLAPDFFTQRFRRIRASEAEYLGIQPYVVNGYDQREGFAATWEMAFDAAFFRERFRPIDVFPRPRLVNGRWLTLDTFHDAQHRAGRRLVEPYPGHDEPLVHATQMICQATHLTQAERYIAPENTTILLAPYLLWASGEPASMLAVRTAAEQGRREMRLLGKPIDVRSLTEDRVNGLRAMAGAIEKALVGDVRPQAREYFDALHRLTAPPRRAAA